VSGYNTASLCWPPILVILINFKTWVVVRSLPVHTEAVLMETMALFCTQSKLHHETTSWKETLFYGIIFPLGETELLQFINVCACYVMQATKLRYAIYRLFHHTSLRMEYHNL
jgi:hypothetical protein